MARRHERTVKVKASPPKDYPSWFRAAFGRPRIWHAVTWGILGASAAVFGFTSLGHVANAGLYFVATAVAWAIAVLQGIIALHDRQGRFGSYAAGPRAEEGPEE